MKIFSLPWASFYIGARSKVIHKTVKYLSGTYCVSRMALDARDTHESKHKYGLLSLNLPSPGGR